MAKNKVICDGVLFTEERIKSGSVFLSNSIAFEELGVDTLDIELDLSIEVATIFAPADADGMLTSDNRLFTVFPHFHILATDPSQFTYGKRVVYYRDDTIFSVFYMSSIRRVSKFFYAISCVSAIGLLGNLRHYGGLYNGQTMETVLRDIIGNAIQYTVANNVKSIRVYGWLPVSTCRDNLRQLLFAYGVAVKKSNDGNVSFELLNTSVPFQIPDNRLMLGGSVDFPAAASEAVVIEHSFFSTSLDETVTLYDGQVSASTFISPKGNRVTGILVTFEQPAHSLSVEGVTILESGVNYAVLSAGGYAKLTGKKYTHTTREVVQSLSKNDSNMVGDKNVARVEDATLVNLTNSEAVASRVASYYSSARKIKSKMLVYTERPGDYVTFHNPFDEVDEGLISSMDISISGTLLAQTEFVAGYKPVSGGSYENVKILTGTGTYTVPAGKTKIHAVLISGGYGGYSGLKGKSGIAASKKTSTLPGGRLEYLPVGKGGDGGEAGQGGQGGNIYQTTIDVTPGQTISYNCGKGGTGGASNKDRASESDYSAPGQIGGATTFGNLTSNSGSPSDFGYMDIFSGNIYGKRGDIGAAGGKGGGLDNVTDYWQANLKQTRGPSLVYNGRTYYAGEINETEVSTGSSSRYYQAIASYGAGGGAAAGANGSKATDVPYVDVSYSYSRGNADGGAGGQGADAVAPAKEARYGCGGKGGNGGGGEGGPGYAGVEAYPSGESSSISMPSNLHLLQRTGIGRGLGSNGGAGGDGCILVYY